MESNALSLADIGVDLILSCNLRYKQSIIYSILRRVEYGLPVFLYFLGFSGDFFFKNVKAAPHNSQEIKAIPHTLTVRHCLKFHW